MGGRKVAVLIMLVVVMVGGGNAALSSLTTPNNLATVTCYLDCVRGCRSDPNRNVCIAGCATKCPVAVTVGGATGDASSSLPSSPAASSSSLTTPFCYLDCVRGCGYVDDACFASCHIKCPFVVKVGGAAGDASSSLPTSPDHDRFCNLGCVSSMCTSLISNYDGVNGHEAVKGCLGGCADICSPSSTKLALGRGRDQLV